MFLAQSLFHSSITILLKGKRIYGRNVCTNERTRPGYAKHITADETLPKSVFHTQFHKIVKNSGTCVLLIIWPRLVTSHFIKNVYTATTKPRDICMNKRRSTQSFPRYVLSEKFHSKLYTRPEPALVLGGKHKGCGWNENERKISYW